MYASRAVARWRRPGWAAEFEHRVGGERRGGAIDVDLVAVPPRSILLLGSVEPRAHRIAEFLISISKNLCELDRDVDLEIDFNTREK